MISFKDMLEYCQVEAIANILAPTEESAYRALCRQYSGMFHTPLYLVLKMAPKHVILEVFELQAERSIDTEDYKKMEHVLDTIRGIEDPNYDANKRKEQEEFDRKAEEEEVKRISEGRPVYQSKKTLLKKTEELEKKKPTGGSINLDYLSRQNNEG